MNIDEVRTGVAAAIESGGVRAGLAYLNALGGHRFTAMYRFDGSMLRNHYYYDRENPSVEDTEDFPVEVTFCVYIRESGRPFVLEDALRDARVEGHPAQHRVRAYCGVPIQDREGNTIGTMCHFDCVPVPATDEVVDVMQAVAPLLLR